MIKLEGPFDDGIPVIVISHALASTLAELVGPFRIIQKAAKDASKLRNVAFGKSCAGASKNVSAFGHIARNATCTVGHGFHKRKWHTFHIGREHVDICIRIELGEKVTRDESGKNNARVRTSPLSKLNLKCIGVRTSASNDQALIGIEATESINEQITALLGHQSAKIQDVVATR